MKICPWDLFQNWNLLFQVRSSQETALAIRTPFLPGTGPHLTHPLWDFAQPLTPFLCSLFNLSLLWLLTYSPPATEKCKKVSNGSLPPFSLHHLTSWEQLSHTLLQLSSYNYMRLPNITNLLVANAFIFSLHPLYSSTYEYCQTVYFFKFSPTLSFLKNRYFSVLSSLDDSRFSLFGISSFFFRFLSPKSLAYTLLLMSYPF